MSVWRANENFFQSYRDDPAKARKVAFTANDLGGNQEMDSQGRIQFSAELRRALNLENAPVRLYAYRGHIEVLGDQVYEAMKQESEQGAVENVEALEQAGLL